MLALLLGLMAEPEPFDGARLQDGRACYAMSVTRDGVEQSIGTAVETINRIPHEGRDAIRVVSQQMLRTGEMRDTYLLDAATLRPFSYENEFAGARRIQVIYGSDRITGFHTDRDGRQEPVDVTLTSPVWDGHIYGPAVAALPLADGAVFTVPAWNHNRGLAPLGVKVAGSRQIDTPSGQIEAWVVEVSPAPGVQAEYFVDKIGGRSVGYDAGPMRQRLAECET